MIMDSHAKINCGAARADVAHTEYRKILKLRKDKNKME